VLQKLEQQSTRLAKKAVASLSGVEVRQLVALLRKVGSNLGARP
jgi:hypothetical protein